MDTTKLNERLFKKMCARLSDSRLKKVNAYIRYEDRLLSASAGYLLDCALVDFGTSERQANFIYGEHGKPYSEGLTYNGKSVYFNLSRSGNIAVCAVAQNEVGVDVQKIIPPSQALV